MSPELAPHLYLPPMNRKINEIHNVPYGAYDISCEPTKDEIERAIQENDLESRPFKSYEIELNDEWNKNARSINEYCALQQQYHTRRIAFFVVNGWSDPILLNEDGCRIEDGLHRFKAAIFKGTDSICVKINNSL